MWQLKSKIAFMNIVVRTSTFYIQQNGYNTYMLHKKKVILIKICYAAGYPGPYSGRLHRKNF